MADSTCAQLNTEDFRYLPLEEMRSRVAKFEERVNAAMAATAPTKDWVRKAIRREGNDRCPVRMKRFAHDVIIRHGEALTDLFCGYPDDIAWILPYNYNVGYSPVPEERLDPIQVLMQEAEWRDEWGAGWAHAIGGVGPHPTKPAFTDWAVFEDYLANCVPNPRAQGRMDAAIPLLDMHGQSKYCVGFIEGSIFEKPSYIRGSEDFLMDLYTNENNIQRLIEAVLSYSLEIVNYWAEIGVTRGADAVFLGDDWGCQRSLLISPDKWREIYKPYYKTLFDSIHREGLTIIWHSCGNIMDIIGDLIDIGLDVLDPIQPGPLDISEVAREFGGHISFSGGIDVQRSLVTSTPQQVKDSVRKTIDTLGKPFGNGLIVAPSNHVTPDVPIENLRAMVEACREV